MSQILAPDQGFTVSANLTVSLNFYSDWPMLPW